jgi:hypothetical protein
MTLKTMFSELTSITKNIFGQSDISSVRNIDSAGPRSNSTLDMRQKEKDIYGKDRIEQQKLYEKWAVKKSWHLKDQAIPLLLSMDPDNISISLFDEVAEQKYQDLWGHAQHCVEQDLLLVMNRECPIDEWEANPIDVYKWAAISRVELPKELSSLMEFVMTTMVSTADIDDGSIDNKKQNVITYDGDKERILGAALAMLATYPEKCRNKKGRVRAENILLLINENEGVLFGEKTPDLSPTAALDLINKWLM